VLIEAARRYYQLAFAMPFWTGLLTNGQSGRVLSVDAVLNELSNGNDQLKIWAENDFRSYFMTTDTAEVISSYSTLINWVQAEQQYLQRAKDRFMEFDNADSWVLAFAHAKGYKVVTQEVASPDVKKNIPIPNVCQAFSIPYCNTFEMIAELGITFQ